MNWINKPHDTKINLSIYHSKLNRFESDQISTVYNWAEGTYYWRFDCYWYAHSLPDPVGSWFEFELIIERVWYGDTEYLGLRPGIEITRETRGVGRKSDRGDFRLFWIETSSVASVLRLPRCLIGLMCSLCCISWLKGCSFLTSLW